MKNLFLKRKVQYLKRTLYQKKRPLIGGSNRSSNKIKLQSKTSESIIISKQIELSKKI